MNTLLWSHLPNAHHIDWVIKSVKENPLLWADARRESWDTAPLDGAQVADEAAKYAAAADKAWARAAVEAWDVWEVILALVAYDDCDQYLNMGYEKLRVYAMLSEKPQAILLLPMVGIQEKLYQNALKYNCII